MALSAYLEDAVLGWMRGQAFPAAPGTVYLAAYTTPPADDGTGGAEVAVVRQAVQWGALANPLPNATKITFPDAPEAEGQVTHVALWDAAAGGNLLDVGALLSPVDLDAGERLIFDVGELSVALTG